jgi:hypothetical protein
MNGIRQFGMLVGPLLLAESGPPKSSISGNLSVRFGEKRTLRPHAGNIDNP